MRRSREQMDIIDATAEGALDGMTPKTISKKKAADKSKKMSSSGSLTPLASLTKETSSMIRPLIVSALPSRLSFQRQWRKRRQGNRSCRHGCS